jgi:uncharacterized membrane-anchored protein YhcB (DUF1043 family)
VGDATQSYRELYQSRIQETENLSKKLRERQKMVKVLCVCVCERERERERETDTDQTDRQTD